MGAYYYFSAKILLFCPPNIVFSPDGLLLYSYHRRYNKFSQSAGGGTTGVALTANESTETDTHIMVSGLAFKVSTMSAYL